MKFLVLLVIFLLGSGDGVVEFLLVMSLLLPTTTTSLQSTQPPSLPTSTTTTTGADEEGAGVLRSGLQDRSHGTEDDFYHGSHRVCCHVSPGVDGRSGDNNTHLYIIKVNIFLFYLL